MLSMPSAYQTKPQRARGYADGEQGFTATRGSFERMGEV
jgi:hypothetical protein